MDARPKTVRDILHTGDQYIIPLFQRYYSWQKEHWDRLRKDIWALMEDESKPVHFLGPLVCTPTSHFPGSVPACVFRSIRPGVPEHSGRLFRSLRPGSERSDAGVFLLA